MPNFPAFLAFSLLAIFTPGPNNIMALCNAGKYGFKKSLPFNLGVGIGFLALMSLCMAFSYWLYKVMPAMKPYVAAVGAAYMLFLAYKTLRDRPHADGREKEHTTVLAGAAMQFINPKGILFCITVAANYLAPYYMTLLPIAGLMLALSALTLASTCGWALFGSAFQKFISAHRAPFNIVMALLLAYCAVSLFL